MERAALVPHPRWRRFVSRATQPRVLVAIGAVALLLGVGAIFASQQLLSDDEGPRGPHVGAIDPAEVKVAVLNGTAINGLGGLVSSDLDSSGYDVIATTSTVPGYRRTVGPLRRRPEARRAEGRRRPRGEEGRAPRPRYARARRRRRRGGDRGRGQGLGPWRTGARHAPSDRARHGAVLRPPGRRRWRRRCSWSGRGRRTWCSRSPSRRPTARRPLRTGGDPPRTVEITFFVRESDSHALVGIVDSRGGPRPHPRRRRRARREDEPVTYTWDGRTDAGATRPAGPLPAAGRAAERGPGDGLAAADHARRRLPEPDDPERTG